MLNFIVVILSCCLIYFFLKQLLKKFYFINIYISYMFFCIFIILFIIIIVINPKQSFNSATQGINLFINTVFPSLFPFFICTELLMNLGIINILGILLEPIMKPLFNVPGAGAFAFVIGIVSGYPVGAKATVNLRENELCSKIEGERLLTFCNNSGPLFILGAIAVGMFNEPSIGLILFISHIAASLTVGLIFKFYKINKCKQHKKNYISHIHFKEIKYQIKHNKNNMNFGKILSKTIKNSINSLLMIGGFIVFFSVLISFLKQIKVIFLISNLLSLILVPFGISKDLTPALASGIFEITTGIKMISLQTHIPLVQKLIVTSLILGWGGLSVHSQVLSLIYKSDIRISPYLIGKALQSFISAFYTYIIFKHTTLNTTPVISLLLPEYQMSNYNAVTIFCLSLKSFINIIIFLFLLGIVVYFIKYVKHKY